MIFKKLPHGNFRGNEWHCDACLVKYNNGIGLVRADSLSGDGDDLGTCDACQSPMWMPSADCALQTVDQLFCGVTTILNGPGDDAIIVYESEEDCFFWGDGASFEPGAALANAGEFVIVTAVGEEIVVGLYPSYEDLFEGRGGAKFTKFGLVDSDKAAACCKAIVEGWE